MPVKPSLLSLFCNLFNLALDPNHTQSWGRCWSVHDSAHCATHAQVSSQCLKNYRYEEWTIRTKHTVHGKLSKNYILQEEQTNCKCIITLPELIQNETTSHQPVYFLCFPKNCHKNFNISLSQKLGIYRRFWVWSESKENHQED